MKVQIADLKAHLCAYLRQVRAGADLVVSDRQTPFAVISPLRERADDLKVRKATRPLSTLRRIRGVDLLKDIDPVRVLLEDRDDR